MRPRQPIISTFFSAKTLDSTSIPPVYFVVTHVYSHNRISDKIFSISALIKMGGGNGPVKPDNPPAVSRERVPIPAELVKILAPREQTARSLFLFARLDQKSCRKMRGRSNVAKTPEMQGFFVT
jgi:hypothetical protein